MKSRSKKVMSHSVMGLVLGMILFYSSSVDATSFSDYLLTMTARWNLHRVAGFLLMCGFTGNESMLAIAAQCNNTEVAEVFVESGTRFSKKSKVGAEALFGVAYQGNEALVTILLEAEADVTGVNNDDDRETILIGAARGGSQAIVRQLLEVEGCSDTINAIDKRGFTALIWAAQRGGDTSNTKSNYSGILKALAEKEANLDYSYPEPDYVVSCGLSALQCADMWGHVDEIRTLLRLGADVNACRGTETRPVLFDSMDADRASLWLENGSDPDIILKEGHWGGTLRLKKPQTAFTMAVNKGRSNIARMLLARGADPLIGHQTEKVQQFVKENKYLRSEYLSFSEQALEEAGLPQDAACFTLGVAYGDQAKDEVTQDIKMHKKLKEKIRLKNRPERLKIEAANIEGLE